MVDGTAPYMRTLINWDWEPWPSIRPALGLEASYNTFPSSRSSDLQDDVKAMVTIKLPDPPGSEWSGWSGVPFRSGPRSQEPISHGRAKLVKRLRPERSGRLLEVRMLHVTPHSFYSFEVSVP